MQGVWQCSCGFAQTEISKTVKSRLPIGILAGILILAVIGTFLWFRRNSLSAVPSLFATSTPTVTTTFTRTSTPTATLTRTPRPTPTATPLPVWVSDFAEPILSAITNQPPKIQDDFSNNSGGWHCPPWRQQALMNFVDSELVFGNACTAVRSNMAFTDFVLELDERFLQGSSSNWLRIGFRDQAENPEEFLAYEFQINHDGSFSINWPPTQRKIEITSGITRPESKSNHILIITKGSHFAFFVNDQPLYYLTDTTIWQKGTISFTAYSTIALDNLKIWDISDLP
jgi:hypothetical protein